MDVELRLFATFREVVGEKVVRSTFPDDATVGDVLRDLEATYPSFRGELLTDSGEVAPTLTVMKNGRNVANLRGADTDLVDGDALSITPPVTGG